MESKLKILGIGIGALIIANLLVLDFFWINQKRTTPKSLETEALITAIPSPTPTLSISQITPPAGCSAECSSYIDQKINNAISGLPTPVAAKGTIIQSQPTPSSKVAYITIGGSSSTSSTSWTDIPGTDFYFDLSDYPSASNVRWEVSLQSYLSSDPAYARLYDVTNKRAVDGSEQTTRSSSAYEYLRSGDLTIWRGNNLYRIQAKGSSGNVVNIISPRLKIILD